MMPFQPFRASSSFHELKQLRTLAISGLFLALAVVLSRFSWKLSPSIQISFSYLPIACAAMLFGPIAGGALGALNDIIQATLFPAGPYFPGFTLTALIGGLVYGMLLYKREVRLWHIALSRALVVILGNVLLNTVWLSIMGGNAFWALLPARAIKNALQYPVDLILLSFVLVAVRRAYRSLGLQNRS